MNATTENRRAAADLEREANEIRADMDRTLDALERKFSPGQLLDRSVGYLRDHGAELTRNVGDTVKRNPVPVLMTAAGLVWLVASTMRSNRSHSASTSEYDDEYAPKRHGRMHQRMTAARDRIRETRDAATEKVSGKVGEVMHATRERTGQAQERVRTMVDEQPLALGAIAVAVGAIIGAVLPSTEYEDRTVGQMRDRTLAKAKQVGEQQYEHLRDKLETHEDAQTQTPGRVN